MVPFESCPAPTVAPGVFVGSGAFIGANAVLLGLDGNKPAACVEKEAHIGANATILSGVKVGIGARVAPGSVVTTSVPPLAIVEGNPGRITGYVDSLWPVSSV